MMMMMKLDRVVKPSVLAPEFEVEAVGGYFGDVGLFANDEDVLASLLMD